MRKIISLCLVLLCVASPGYAIGPESPSPDPTSTAGDETIAAFENPATLPDALLWITPPRDMPVDDQSEGEYYLFLLGDGENADLFYIFTAEALEGVPADYTFSDFSEEGLDSMVSLLDLFESGMEMSYQEGDPMLGSPTLRIFSDPLTQYQWALLRNGWLYTGGVFSLSDALGELDVNQMLDVFTLEPKE